jgi:hypothetical protein
MTESEGLEMKVNVENFPPESEDIKVKTVTFGSISSPTVLVELGAEDDETLVVYILIGGTSENEDVPEFLEELSQLFGMIARSEETKKGLAEALAEQEKEEEE